MSTNCLLTKLKGIVDNDSLVPYGYVKFTIHAGTKKCRMYIGGAFDAKIKGEANFLDAEGQVIGKEITTNSNYVYISASETESYVFVECRYERLDWLSFAVPTGQEADYDQGRFSIDLEQFSYSPDFRGITTVSSNARNFLFGDASKFLKPEWTHMITLYLPDNESVYGDISEVIPTSITSINLFNTGIAVDLAKISELSIPNFIMPSKAYGDFAELGKISGFNMLYGVNVVGVTGSIEGFVENAKIRGAGRVMFEWCGYFPNVTYKGISLATSTEVIRGSNVYFNWDAEGNITWTAS